MACYLANIEKIGEPVCFCKANHAGSVINYIINGPFWTSSTWRPYRHIIERKKNRLGFLA